MGADYVPIFYFVNLHTILFIIVRFQKVILSNLRTGYDAQHMGIFFVRPSNASGRNRPSTR